MSKAPAIYGHRGCRGKHPENSLAAFQHAYRSKARGIETDLRLTRDGHLVLLHDAEVPSVGAVRKLTLRELQQKTPSLCTLDLLLQWQEKEAAHFELDLELKGDGMEAAEKVQLVERLLERLSNSGNRKAVWLSTFDPILVKLSHAFLPDIPKGFLTEGEGQWWQIARDLGCKKVLPHFSCLGPADVEKVHQMGLELIVWTLNPGKDADTMKGWKIDGIITDIPDEW